MLFFDGNCDDFNLHKLDWRAVSLPNCLQGGFQLQMLLASQTRPFQLSHSSSIAAAIVSRSHPAPSKLAFPAVIAVVGIAIQKS